MKKHFSFSDETDSTLGTRSEFLEELRKSFTGSFAYDLFNWPAVPGSASVTFNPPTFVAAPNGDDRGQEETDDPVSLYTSNADIPVYLTGEVVTVGDGGIAPQTDLSGPLVGVDDFRVDARFAGVDGSGYTIAVLDTGIDLDDPFFGPDLNNDGISDRIVYQYDFADGDANASDFDGHGSNVSSIAASSDGTYTGMAPGAGIAALKVFEDSGDGYFLYIEEALQWVIANAEAYNIVSVNMSLGDTANYDVPISLYGIGDELATLAAMDVIVVSSSGNSFYSFNSVQGVGYPSADPNSLSVGAVYSGDSGGWQYQSGAIAYTTTADQITPFSQRDAELSDIFAPGAPITGAGAGAELVQIHGTSQAAPHIAGIVALAQDLAVQEIGRKLSFDEIQALLDGTGDTIIDGDDEDDNVNNTGLAFQRVNVLALGEAILDLAAPEGERDPTYFQVSALDKSAPEGDSGGASYSFLLTRSGDLSEADTIDYGVAGSGASAADAADFPGGSLPGGSVTFDVGETSKVVTIQVAGDIEVEADETFELTINSVPPNGQVVLPSDEATIENDDAAGGGPVVLLQADFNGSGDTGGFVYRDDLFGGNNGRYADGDWEGQALTVTLGGINNFVITGMTGGWETSITLDEDMEVNLSFLYELIMEEQYESDEYSQVLVSIDGGTPIVVDEMAGNGNGGPDETTGTQTFLASLGTLAAGDHTLAIGLYNSKKTWRDESSYLTIDDVTVTGTASAAAAAAATTIDTYFAIAAEDAVKAEGDAGATAFSFTVTRSGDTSGADSVDYSVTGSGINAGDFVGGTIPSGSLAFAAGETSKTVTIQVAGDIAIETDEGFGVVLANPSAGTAIETAGAVGIIVDDDDPAAAASSYAIAALDAVKAEGDAGLTDFTFTVTRSGDVSKAGLVSYEVTAGDTDAGDFANGILPHGALFFDVGETSKTITVQVAGDSSLEGDEFFDVTLFDALGGAAITTAFAVGTISGDDGAVLAIEPFAVAWAEGDSGTTDFTFTVTRSGNTSLAGSVDYSVSSSEADGTDFVGGVLPNGTLNFIAGQVSQDLTFQVVGDTDFEPTEHFTVTLSNPSVYFEIDTATAAGTIINDDPPPGTFLAIFADDVSKDEGDSGATAFTFTVNRSNDVSGPGSVDYVVTGQPSSAIDGQDFVGGVLPSGTVSFAAGETTKKITILVQGDTEYENGETFNVALTNPTNGMEIVSTAASAYSVIANDDPYSALNFLSISALDAVKLEGDSGTTTVTFTVSRSGDLTTSCSVRYHAGSGADPAANALDFASGSFVAADLEFAPGETSKTLSFEVLGDTDIEDDENFVVYLQDPSFRTEITNPVAQGTILNDDSSRGTTYFFASAYDAAKPEGTGGTTDFTFLVTRSGDTTAPDTIDYAVTGSGANPADAGDFAGGVLPSGSVTFATGETAKYVTIQVAADSTVEAEEYFTLTISNPPPNGQIQKPADEATIENDDFPPGGPFVLIDADFNGSFAGTEGFDYVEGIFGGPTDPALTRGNWTAADITVVLGGGGSTQGTMTGGWERSFTLDQEMDLSLSFLYDIFHSREFEADEYTQVLVSIDGGTPILIDQIAGDAANTADYIVDPTTVELNLGTFGAGDHTIVIGGLLNKMDGPSEYNTIGIDDVLLIGSTPAAPATFFAIAAEDAVKAEGDAGTTAFTFMVTRSGDTSGPGSVDWAVSGAAVDAADFGGSLPGGTVSFVGGEVSKTITVNVAGDTDFEGDEAFTVTLSNPSANSEITIATADGTILNDDPAPPSTFFALAAEDAVKAEGDAGTTAFTFTVTRSGDTSGADSVDWAVSGSGATGADFGGSLPGGTVNFAAGEVSKTVTVNVTGDTDFEADEAFTVNLSNASAGATITTASADGTILNDDTPAAGPVTVIDESFDSDSGAFTYADNSFGGLGGTDADGSWDSGALRVDLGGGSNTTVTDMSGGWTTSFTLDTESEVSLSFLYELTQSEQYEDDEYSQVLVSIDGGAPILVASLTGDGNGGGAQTTGLQTFNAMIGVLAAGDHSLTIGAFNNKKTWSDEFTDLTIDDVTATATPTTPPEPIDTSYAIAAGDAVLSEGDAGTTIFTFTVTRSGDLVQDGSVDFTVVGAGANADDFLGGLLPGGSIIFDSPGVSETTISIEVVGDTDFETDEDFLVVLSNPAAGGEVTVASATGTILNDDPEPSGPVTLVEADFNASGDTGGFVYSDGVFGGGSAQANADGSWSGGALTIDLGAGSNSLVTDMSGAWEIDFSLAADMDVSLSFNYELLISTQYEPDEYSQLLVSIDGGAPITVDELFGDGNGGPDQTTGLQAAALDLGSLAAGDHTLAIGGYNSKKTWSDEFTEITIDDVMVTGTVPAGGSDAAPAGLVAGGGAEAQPLGLSETELLSSAGF